MIQVNVRIGERPIVGGFECTINGIKKPFKETLELANKMFEVGEGSTIVIDGDTLTVEKALFDGDRLIAEAHEWNTHFIDNKSNEKGINKMMSQKDIERLKEMENKLKEEFNNHDTTRQIPSEMLDRFQLIEWAKNYSKLLKETNTENKHNCISKISDTIKTFLHNEGGYQNGYTTYVNGTVNADKEGVLDWCTPTAKEELTPKGIESRGKALYNSVQSILKDHNLDSVLIEGEHVDFGAFETYIVFANETTGRVSL